MRVIELLSLESKRKNRWFQSFQKHLDGCRLPRARHSLYNDNPGRLDGVNKFIDDAGPWQMDPRTEFCVYGPKNCLAVFTQSLHRISLGLQQLRLYGLF